MIFYAILVPTFSDSLAQIFISAVDANVKLALKLSNKLFICVIF